MLDLPSDEPATLNSVSFQLPEYDEAFARFIHTTANELARAQHPILGEIRTETVEGTTSSVVDARGQEQLNLSSEPIGFEIRWNRADLLNGNVEALLIQLDQSSNELGEKLVGTLIETLSAVTESTGNVVDAGGKKFSFELLVEMLETMEWSLDDDDELVMPGILMHPDQMKNLPSEATPEQQLVLNELKDRKREELLAQRRSRRLS